MRKLALDHTVSHPTAILFVIGFRRGGRRKRADRIVEKMRTELFGTYCKPERLPISGLSKNKGYTYTCSKMKVLSSRS